MFGDVRVSKRPVKRRRIVQGQHYRRHHRLVSVRIPTPTGQRSNFNPDRATQLGLGFRIYSRQSRQWIFSLVELHVPRKVLRCPCIAPDSQRESGNISASERPCWRKLASPIHMSLAEERPLRMLEWRQLETLIWSPSRTSIRPAAYAIFARVDWDTGPSFPPFLGAIEVSASQRLLSTKQHIRPSSQLKGRRPITKTFSLDSLIAFRSMFPSTFPVLFRAAENWTPTWFFFASYLQCVSRLQILDPNPEFSHRFWRAVMRSEHDTWIDQISFVSAAPWHW